MTISRGPSPIVRRLALGLIAPLVALILQAVAVEAKTVRTQALDLAGPGAVTVQGRLSGDAIAAYTVQARDGQVIHLRLQSAGADMQVQLTGPLGSRTNAGGGSDGGMVTARVTQSGSHRIAVILTKDARRRGDAGRYRMRLAFAPIGRADPLPDEPRPAEPDLPVAPDEPDAPDLPVLPDDEAGGPTFWRVRGLGGNLLAVRAGPGTDYPILAQLPEGAVVANLGCRGRGKGRWCRVGVRALDLEGWSSAGFLAKASAPRPDDGAASGRPEGRFDAKGALPCAARRDAPIAACDYLLRRDRGGKVRLWVQTDPRRWRLIRFADGLPTGTDGAARMTVDLRGPLFRIATGRERFEVPASIVRPR